MKISLLHATRRLEAAKKCQQLWLERADNSTNIEIITCVDHDDEVGKAAFPDAVISNENTVVAAWNKAAEEATGDVLVALDDDWQPAHAWDQIIESYMSNGADILHIGDKHRKDELICHPIVSKRFYEAMGYLWHPSFKSVYCDNWFTEVAKRWGYVDATKGGKVDLGFLHANPSQGYGEEDDVARKSNSKERYEHGATTLGRLQSQTILAFTCADRPQYLKPTLDSWLKTNLSLLSSVHFFIEPTDKRHECVAVIDEFAAKSPVPVIKHFNKEKLGVLRNPWHLFDHCFRIEGAIFTILGEDDFLVSPDILDFLWGTSRWNLHGDEKTMAICAKWVGDKADKNPATWHRVTEFTGNIWGTWPHVWNKYLKDTWDFDYSSGKADGTSCVPYSTKILTKNGWLSVRDLNIGDETIGFNHKTKKSEWTTIEDIVEYGCSSLYSFGTKGIQLTSTENHRWIVSSETGENMTHTCNLSRSDRIVTSAPLENNSKLNCSVDEAAVLGWIAGDGSFLILKDNGLNAKVNQKKVQNIFLLDELFSRIPHTRKIYKDVVQWRLPTPYARDLLKRVGNPKKDSFSQVIQMSPEQREAWLNAMLLAEGSQHGNSYRIYQNRGNIEEAVRFAIFASGRRPQTHVLTGKPQWKECVAINSSKPIIGMGEKVFIGSAPVWCVKTKLGTWTARQGDQVFLTGNSGWDHNIGLRVMPKNDLHCIVPTASRSKHIGITGVHCTEEVFDDTVAWNFVEHKYDGVYCSTKDMSKTIELPTVTVSSSGDLGDCVVSLATLVYRGNPVIYHLWDDGLTKGIVAREKFIRPFLESQPIIKAVRIGRPDECDWRSEDFRRVGVHDRKTNLAAVHAKHAHMMGFIEAVPVFSEPWIKVSDFDFHGKIVINRSPRYNNDYFPWGEIVKHYGDQLVFVGLDEEYAAFRHFGDVKHVKVKNMLELAKLIAGSSLFIGNQSSAMTIAEGLKHPRILEGCIDIPDCIYPPSNAQYVFDGSVVLPAINGKESKRLRSNLIHAGSFDTSIVPRVGRGYGWCWEGNGVRFMEGTVRKAAFKVAKFTGMSQEEAENEVVMFTVRLAPQNFGSNLRSARFHAPHTALQESGWKEHPIFDVMSGQITSLL